MLFAQTKLLQLFGILPWFSDNFRYLSPVKKILSSFQILIATALLAGTLYSSCLQCANFLSGFSQPDSTDENESNTPLKVIKLMPFPIINSRGLIVLFVLFVRRQKWTLLMSDLRQFSYQCIFGSFLTESVNHKCRIIGVILFIITAALHALWETVEWTAYIGSMPNSTILSGPFIKTVAVATLLSSVPYILSQQVYICALILAILLNESLKALSHSIYAEVSSFNVDKDDPPEKYDGQKLALLSLKVVKWETYHTQILIFFGSVNEFFSLPLFLIHGMDFLAVLGFVANVVVNSRSDIMSHVYLIGSSLVFLLYGTVFLGPLVSVHEKVSGRL